MIMKKNCDWFDWPSFCNEHITKQQKAANQTNYKLSCISLCWLGIKQVVYIACSKCIYSLIQVATVVLYAVWEHSWPNIVITPFSCSVGLRLLCSKIYLLFFWEFPKIFSYYSFVLNLLFPSNSQKIHLDQH